MRQGDVAVGRKSGTAGEAASRQGGAVAEELAFTSLVPDFLWPWASGWKDAKACAHLCVTTHGHHGQAVVSASHPPFCPSPVTELGGQHCRRSPLPDEELEAQGQSE